MVKTVPANECVTRAVGHRIAERVSGKFNRRYRRFVSRVSRQSMSRLWLVVMSNYTVHHEWISYPQRVEYVRIYLLIVCLKSPPHSIDTPGVC